MMRKIAGLIVLGGMLLFLNADSQNYQGQIPKQLTRDTLLLYENFDDTIFPPPGWQRIILVGSYNWQRYVSQYPAPIQQMAMYPSWYASSGSMARLIIPALSVGSNPTICTLKFLMMHDPGYSTVQESILIETSIDGSTFNRVTAFRRYAPTQALTEHIVNLGSFTGSFYVAFKALSGYGNNMYIDSIRIFGNIYVPPQNDVGIDSIIYPQTTHRINTAMVPVARVKNYGTVTQNNFPVICSIVGANGTLRYTNTQNVSSLAPSHTTLVNFSAWVPNVLERCTVKMRTYLSGDENPLNDRKTGITQIISWGMFPEGFESTTFPPAGWQSVILNGTYNWQRMTSNTDPTCVPYEGTAMASYQSFSAVAGSQARLISLPIYAGSTPFPCTMQFYMFHDSAYPGGTYGPDSVKVEISTDGINFNRAASYRRYEPGSPQWTRHKAYLGTLSGVFYLGLLAVSEYGNNINIDLVGPPIPGITADDKNDIILNSILNPPKPNPITNGLAHLSFTLAEPSQVSLKIFDASGRLVKTLVDEFKNSGVYSVSWNCRDDYNRKVAEGIYFYTLETPKQKFCRKVVLMQN